MLKHYIDSTLILITNFKMSGIACYSLSPTLKLHISHLRLAHQADPNFKLTCAIEDCTKTFFTFPAFNSHVYRSHRRCLGLNSKYNVQDEGSSTCSPTVGRHLTDDQAQQSTFGIIIEDHDTIANDQTNVTLSFDEDLKIEEQAKFMLNLREGQLVSQVALNKVVTKCRSLCEESYSIAISRVKRVLLNSEIKVDNVEGLNDVLESSPLDYFDGIDTSYLSETFARKNMNYVVSDACNVCFLYMYIAIAHGFSNIMH